MKKLYLLLMLILISLSTIGLTANDNLADDDINLYNENYVNEIINNSLDEKDINYYSKYVKINNSGFYEIDDSLFHDNNQKLIGIKNNIELINALIKENLIYIDDTSEIIVKNDEIKTLFGYNFKLNWYGINATLDRTGMALFGFLGSLKYLKIGVNILKMFSKNKIKNDLIDIKGFILNKGAKFFNSHILSIAKNLENYEGLLIAAILSAQFALTAFTGGTWAIINTFLNYFLEQFLPTFVETIKLLFSGAGILQHSACNIRIRWWYGWGTSFSFI